MANQARPWIWAAGVCLFCSATWMLRSSLTDLGFADVAHADVAAVTGADATADESLAADAPPNGSVAAPGGGTIMPIADPARGTDADPAADGPAPTTQPAGATPGPNATQGHGGRGGNRHRGAGGVLGMGSLVGPGDRDVAMTWLSEHAPNQFKAIKAFPAERQTEVETAIAQAFGSYQRIKLEDQDGLYDVIVKRVEVDDRVFGLGADYRKATDEAVRSALRKELVKQLDAQVDVTLHERHLRLDRLKQTVRQADEKLAADTANRSRMVDDRLNRITHGGGNWPPPTSAAGDPGR